MKSKLLTALIVDQNADQARQFSVNLKEIFNKLYIESDLTHVISEFEKVKPDVLFINLSLPQRSQNFEMLEKLESLGEKMIVLGINDQIEEELLAHAIESGVHDIFVRPFDPDLISTKINRFFISEKAQERELQYSKLTPPIKAQVNFNFKLKSVDENGLTFESEHNFSKGTHLILNAPLIAEIFGTASLEFMITRTWVSDDLRDFFFYVEPRDTKEELNAALRRFILRKI